MKVYAVEITHQSGEVEVSFVDHRPDWIGYGALASLVGRTDRTDGVKSIRKVVCHNPVWTAYEAEEET